MTEKARSISGGDESCDTTVIAAAGHHQHHHDNLSITMNFLSDINSIMNTSQISASSVCATSTAESTTSQTKTNLNITHNIGGGYCRFPKLEECAHFHYERVQLGQISIRLVEDKSDLQSSNASQHDNASQILQTSWFIMKVSGDKSDPFLIRRSFENVQMLDEMLHRCVYDRKISGLRNLSELVITADLQIENIVSAYLTRFSNIASDSLTCGPILTWLQLDNKGRRLPLADINTMKSINTPAVGAAYGIRKYTAQAVDEISIDVGDMISVIDMPSPAESTWWRGKKSHMQKSHYEVGFFPQTCVATIGDKVPRHLVLPAPLVGSLEVSPTKPVLRKHGKLIAFFRSFILSRPSRRRLKQSGIYKERVFSCDLSEHLLNSGQDIPMVLKCCAEFIEEYGIVDGIYRLSGITSNIQKLRRGFDEERVPDLTHPEIRQDIHALSSLLKMYFRELPNPLCTYQLYDHFVDAIQTRGDASERLRLMKETVQKLPPPHYRTLKYLATHLNKISHHSANTGMTDRNLAIVWAPNLLRSPALESGGVAALRGVGVQAVVTEYLITNCGLIFDANDDFDRYESLQCDSLTDTESLQIEQRDHHDHSLYIERPKSLSVGGPRLISLEEAQTRHNRLEFIDVNKSNPINTPGGGCSSYIEVGGGPSSLPDKYHTVLPVPRSWQKRKTHSWKSLFTRNGRNSNSNQDIKHFNPTKKAHITISSPCHEEEATVKHISLRNGADKITKSIDIYESSGKPMDVCVRSSSIDSLRTAGHSRSVSHDSYFDLLQSPLRAGTTATCPSRELSELGINFDREEPEMRIFSESESLVSSPKVAKESQRRQLRSRHDDYASSSGATHSINPSPKKQPRLNMHSPNSNHNEMRWSATLNPSMLINDDSNMTCKRYKLEDQLSDIQFIDCSTPEHIVNHSNTIYASVQIHNPPQSSNSSDLNGIGTGDTLVDCKNKLIFGGSAKNVGNNRYSYPVERCSSNDGQKEERFSYPGMGKKFVEDKKYVCRVPVNDENDRHIVNVNNQKKIGRFSYCDPHKMSSTSMEKSSAVNVIVRSSSAAEIKIGKNADIQRSKLSIATPSSPIRSPRYSLLVGGDTSSENSSSLNTPIFDMEMSGNGLQMMHNDEISLMSKSVSSPTKRGGGSTANYDTKEYANNSTFMSEDSFSNMMPQSPPQHTNSSLGSGGAGNTTDSRDISIIKRELSLDLEGSKMSVDDTSLSLSLNNKQIINIPSTPNTPNFTHTSGNTSQSMTPSEFGYQHLNRPSSAAVSLDSSPKSGSTNGGAINIYENLEQSFSSYDGTTRLNIVTVPKVLMAVGGGSSDKPKVSSPIKSTINITYNLKSPLKTHENVFFQSNLENNKQTNLQSDYEIVNVERAPISVEKHKPLLETSFDENMVYEQVKFFKGAVSEVNSLLDNGNENLCIDEHQLMATDRQNSADEMVDTDDSLVNDMGSAEPQIVPNSNVSPNDPEVNSNLIDLNENGNSEKRKFVDNDDVPMSEQDIEDSLELDQNISLYENVDFRKPATVYENIDVQSQTTKKLLEEQHQKDTKPANFIVRQLANKFETSPVDVQPPFDFSKPFPRKLDNNRNSPCFIKAKNSKQLHKSAKTRSLDENAFVREFGEHKLNVAAAKSTQQIPEVDVIPMTNPSRRMSLEFIRPKSLNPPKHLPNLIDADTEICKTEQLSRVDKLKLDLTKEPPAPIYPIKITPTTENPISLIQHNVNMEATTTQPNAPPSDDEKSLSSLSSIKVLGIVKLDRDRIEKIKEERRHQLSEKFRSESFRGDATAKAKSKSKCELRDLKEADTIKSDSLRFKSKSRGDVRSIINERNQSDGPIITTSTLSLLSGGVGRIRRISDEKNQNDCIDYMVEDTKMTEIRETSSASSVTTKAKKFDVKKEVEFGMNRDSLSLANLQQQQLHKNNLGSQREKISPQFSIRDVAAMFESRSQQ